MFEDKHDRTGSTTLRIALPEPSATYDQDTEWCVVDTGDGWREIRFHDYSDVYPIAGLYERLFYDILECASPRTVRELLAEELTATGTDPAELRVLDLGAGNGIMGEELRRIGVASVVGADLIPEARDAALRDRPGVYADYAVADMTALTAEQRAGLETHKFTALTCVAALGFGDIPPEAFRQAYNLVADGGWIAFNIKDDFVSDADRSGFAGLIKDAVENGRLEVLRRTTYQHRLSTAGDPLPYQAVIGRKLGDIDGE